MRHTIVPKINFITYCLGCRTNQAELEVISDQLLAIGFRYISLNTKTQPPTPNLILVNTCMVTQKAERETRKAIRYFRKLHPQAKIVVLGCAVTAKDRFKIDLPEADLLISNAEKEKATQTITGFLIKHGNVPVTEANSDTLLCDRIATCHYSGSEFATEETTTKSNYEESGRKFIKVQDGCSNYCSFCITTYLRGEPKSKEPDKLINQINELTDSKIKEIILTGINIGLYGVDLIPQTNIWGLVDRILKETKVERLTLSTVYPEMLDKLQIINNTRLTKCFHLALQSGSPTVLKRMNRPTDLRKLLGVINEIRKVQPDLTFRADVITAFPDETEKEHQETLTFIRLAKICFVHVFPFSPRVGTMAYEMIRKKVWKDLPMDVKKRRAREIRLLAEILGGELSRRMVGKTYQVLVIREVDNGWEGITENGWTIKIHQNVKIKMKNDKLKIKDSPRGNIRDVKITGYEQGQLLGEILSLPI